MALWVNFDRLRILRRRGVKGSLPLSRTRTATPTFRTQSLALYFVWFHDNVFCHHGENFLTQDGQQIWVARRAALVCQQNLEARARDGGRSSPRQCRESAHAALLPNSSSRSRCARSELRSAHRRPLNAAQRRDKRGPRAHRPANRDQRAEV